ncbi:hypothetical protein SDC9_208970 [bioreactor metagenome]|uniref:Tetratricopeptide repeat protein n=1 Tax=bioreactor metagenome TaxID=1076179 RepID=A0A645JCR7_9ZZZZ
MIDHVGYTKEVIERTNKVYRNIKMLSDSLNFAGEDSYTYYQLGKSYYMLKDYKKAISAFENALMLDVNINLEYVEDLIETYGYAMLNTSAYKQALKLLRFKDSFNDSCDFQFLIALTYMNNGCTWIFF